MDNDTKQKTDSLKTKFKSLEQRVSSLEDSRLESNESNNHNSILFASNIDSLQQRVTKLEGIISNILTELDLVRGLLDNLHQRTIGMQMIGSKLEVHGCNCQTPCGINHEK